MNSTLMMQKLVFIAPLMARMVLYVLIGLSVLSIGVIIERWWYFRRRRDDMQRALRRGSARGCARGDWSARAEGPRGSRSVEAEIVGEALDWYDDGPEAVEQILVKAIRLRRKKFEVGVAVPRHAGEQRPLHRPLRHRARHRHGVPRARRQPGWARRMGNVMSGIAEALLATAVGILVAIPAVIFYNVFQKKGADIEEQRRRARQRRARLDARHARTANASPRAPGRWSRRARRRARGPCRRRWRPRPWPARCRAAAAAPGPSRPSTSRRSSTWCWCLLVILMVASTYIVAQTLKVQLPRAKSTDGTAEKPTKVELLKGGPAALERGAGPGAGAGREDEGRRRRRSGDEPGRQRRQRGDARQRRARAGPRQAGRHHEVRHQRPAERRVGSMRALGPSSSPRRSTWGWRPALIAAAQKRASTRSAISVAVTDEKKKQAKPETAPAAAASRSARRAARWWPRCPRREHRSPPRASSPPRPSPPTWP